MKKDIAILMLISAMVGLISIMFGGLYGSWALGVVYAIPFCAIEWCAFIKLLSTENTEEENK